MDKDAAIAIIHDFRLALQRLGIEASEVVLFGSFATGHYTEDSDIDLVIVSSDFEGMSYWQRIDILSDAIYELFQPIEAIAMTPHEWENEDSLAVQFAKGGETVYSGPSSTEE